MNHNDGMSINRTSIHATLEKNLVYKYSKNRKADKMADIVKSIHKTRGCEKKNS